MRLLLIASILLAAQPKALQNILSSNAQVNQLKVITIPTLEPSSNNIDIQNQILDVLRATTTSTDFNILGRTTDIGRNGIVSVYRVSSGNTVYEVNVTEGFDGSIDVSNSVLAGTFNGGVVPLSTTVQCEFVAMTAEMTRFLTNSESKVEMMLDTSYDEFTPYGKVLKTTRYYVGKVDTEANDVTISFGKNSNGNYYLIGVTS